MLFRPGRGWSGVGSLLGWGRTSRGQGRMGVSMAGDASERRDGLIGLLKRDALKTGTFTLASGRTSHYYVDGRQVTLSAEGAALIGAAILDRLAAHPEVDAVGGLTMGADPIVGSTLAAAG